MSYNRFKERIQSHLFVSIIPMLLSLLFLHVAIQLLLLYIVTSLIWGTALVRVWRYRPPTEENPALVHIWKMLTTLCFFAELSICALASTVLFFQAIPALFVGIFFSLLILSLLAIFIVGWQGLLISKAEQSARH